MESFFIIITIISVFTYFIPAMIAWSPPRENRYAIFFINLLLGWTFLGWLAAFIWACVSPKAPTVVGK